MGIRRWLRDVRDQWNYRGVTHLHYLERRTGKKVEYQMIRLENGQYIRSESGTLPRYSGHGGTFGAGTIEERIAHLENVLARYKADGFVEVEPPEWFRHRYGRAPDTDGESMGFYEDPDHHEIDGTKVTEESTWTHSGMYVMWLDTHGMLEPPSDPADLPLLEQARARSITPGAFFGKVYGGWLSEEHLTGDGHPFTHRYYKTTGYKADYKAHLVPSRKNFYSVEDTWENFDLLKPVLDERYAAWKEAEALP